MADEHFVHAGETVAFDFVLHDGSGRLVDPHGLADYAVLTVGSARLEAPPDLSGHFRFTHAFPDAEPGQRFVATAGAFRQRGSRDFLQMGDRWVRAESPYERPDALVAQDSVRFIVYQAVAEIVIPAVRAGLDAESGVLRLRREDGTTSTVYMDRPHRRGFHMSGPDEEGAYQVRYQPGGDEVNPSGTTEAEFVVHDLAGTPHRHSVMIETP